MLGRIRFRDIPATFTYVTKDKNTFIRIIKFFGNMVVVYFDPVKGEITSRIFDKVNGKAVERYSRNVGIITLEAITQTPADCNGQAFRLLDNRQKLTSYTAKFFNPGVRIFSCTVWTPPKVASFVNTLATCNNTFVLTDYHRQMAHIYGDSYRSTYNMASAAHVASATKNFSFLSLRDADDIQQLFTKYYPLNEENIGKLVCQNLNQTSDSAIMKLQERQLLGELTEHVLETSQKIAIASTAFGASSEVMKLAGLKNNRYMLLLQPIILLYLLVTSENTLLFSMGLILASMMNELTIGFAGSNDMLKDINRAAMFYIVDTYSDIRMGGRGLTSYFTGFIVSVLTSIIFSALGRQAVRMSYSLVTKVSGSKPEPVKVEHAQVRGIIKKKKKTIASKASNRDAENQPEIIDDVKEEAITDQDQFVSGIQECAHGILALGNDNDLNEAERFLSSLFADNKKSLPEVVDYEFSDQDGNPSLLYLMGKSGNTPMVKLLLKFGAKIDKATAAGTPLCGAVRAGHIETASLLIERSAYIMLADANHNTYLHAAAIDGQTAMFRLLVEAGIPPEQKNVEGKTAIQIAREAGHEAAVAELKKIQLEYLQKRVAELQIEVIKQLMQAGFSTAETPCRWVGEFPNPLLYIPANLAISYNMLVIQMKEKIYIDDSRSYFVLPFEAALGIPKVLEDKIIAWRHLCELEIMLNKTTKIAGINFALELNSTNSVVICEEQAACDLLTELLSPVAEKDELRVICPFNKLIYLSVEDLTAINCSMNRLIEHYTQVKTSLLKMNMKLFTEKNICFLPGVVRISSLSVKQVILLAPLINYFNFKLAEEGCYVAAVQDKMTSKLPLDVSAKLLKYNSRVDTVCESANKAGNCAITFKKKYIRMIFVEEAACKTFREQCELRGLEVTAKTTLIVKVAYLKLFGKRKVVAVATAIPAAVSSCAAPSGSAVVSLIGKDIPETFSSHSGNIGSSSSTSFRSRKVEKSTKNPSNNNGSSSTARIIASGTAAERRERTGPRIPPQPIPNPKDMPSEARYVHVPLRKLSDEAFIASKRLPPVPDYVFVPPRDDNQEEVFEVARPLQILNEQSAPRAREIYNEFSHSIRYEISYLIALIAWFNQLSYDCQTNPFFINMRHTDSKLTACRVLWAMFIRVNQYNVTHITNSDVEGYDIRNSLLYDFIDGQEADAFLRKLLDGGLENNINCVFSQSRVSELKEISLRFHAGLFHPREINFRQTTLQYLDDLENLVKYFDSIKPADLTDSEALQQTLNHGELPAAENIGLLVPVRNMAEIIIELYKLIRDRASSLKGLDREIRHFMKSCAIISNKLCHEFTLERDQAYWSVPLIVILNKARQGVAVWSDCKHDQPRHEKSM